MLYLKNEERLRDSNNIAQPKYQPKKLQLKKRRIYPSLPLKKQST